MEDFAVREGVTNPGGAIGVRDAVETRRAVIGGAMVLAAGRGRRMRPLSDVVAKPALPLPGGPVIGWALRLAATTGISSVTVNTWWLAGQMEAVARHVMPDGTVCNISREDPLMETAGGLALARDRGLLGDEGPVLVINGDGVLNIDLQPLLARHRLFNDLVTLALLPHLGPQQWSRVLLDHDGLVAAILPPGRPVSGEAPFLYPGVMAISRAALNGLVARPSGVGRALWQPARDAGRLGGVVVSGHWREVGTPRGYLDAVAALLGDGVWRAPNATVHNEADVVGSLIGPGAVVERGVVVARSVVSHGAVVREGARLDRSIVLGKVTVPAGHSLVDGVKVGRVRP